MSNNSNEIETTLDIVISSNLQRFTKSYLSQMSGLVIDTNLHEFRLT